MSTEPDSPQVEFSAGGVVVRGDEVVVIIPTRRTAGGGRALALPKGHPEPGEIVQSLGRVGYRYERGGRQISKEVEFFLIAYRDGDPADHDHEVEEARWMPLREAATALTFAGERAIIEDVISRRPAGR
jgi:8-oxo-dGTP pyrophosphatase MutT (NUDIX family)